MDARVRYTKKMIRETFFLLLEKLPVSRITVTAICEGAMINRATFYKYYDNPYDLLKKLEHEVLDELQKQITEAEAEGNLLQLFRIVLHDVSEKKQMYLVLFSENGDELFKERIFELCYGKNMENIRTYFPMMAAEQQEWLYYFLAEGCSGLLNRWIKNDMKEAPEDLVCFMGKIIDSVNRSKLGLLT